MEIRKKEERNFERVTFKINLYNSFNTIYEQFLTKINNRQLLNTLVYMSDFNYIYSGALVLKNSASPESQKAKEYKNVFFSHVSVFKGFAKKYNNIQASGKSKICRASKHLELNSEIFDYYTHQEKLSELDKEWRSTKKGAKYRLRPNVVDEYFKCSTSYIKSSSVSHPPGHHGPPFSKFQINSYSAFFDKIQDLLKKLGSDKQVWFRGQANGTHDLRPGTLRPPYKKIKERSKVDTHYHQQEYFDQFLSKAGLSENFSQGPQSSYIDTLATMQHYDIPTNLLDWSESLFTSMYFAFEPLLLHQYYSKANDKEIQHKVKEMRASGVSISLFNPVRYNSAWQKYCQSFLKSSCICPECPLLANMHKLKRISIPNLAVKETAKIFAPYILGQSDSYNKCELISTHSISKDSSCEEKGICPFRLPVAIYTSQSNARLKQQAGTFTAFSLHDNNIEYKESLENVQDHFLSLGKDICPKPFLYQVVILKNAFEPISAWLHQSGVRKLGIYPELNNVGNHVTEFFSP